MDMVIVAADLQGGHFVSSRYASDVGPDALLNLGLQIGRPVFRAEDNVDIKFE
jgi:hypothetical protein